MKIKKHFIAVGAKMAGKGFKVTQVPKPVTYDVQYWESFNTLPPTSEGMGPSGINLWIYYPHDNSLLNWTNWSGDTKDITHLKKHKALWCYKTSPMVPR